MAHLKYDQITNLRLQLYNNRSRAANKWRTISTNISPYRLKNPPYERFDYGRKRQRILRNVAGLSLRTFVSGMHSGATPPTRPWFYLTTINPDLFKNHRAKQWLAKTEAIIQQYLGVSNFYRVTPSVYKDIGLFSNAAYAMLPDPTYGFWFYPFSVGTFGFAANSRGTIDTFFRDFTLSVRQVVHRYGQLNAGDRIDWSDIHPYVKDLWEEGRYQDQVVLSNVIIPNPHPNPDAIHSSEKLYQSYTYVASIQPGTASTTNASLPSIGIGYDHQKFLSIKGYDYFPIICPRWEVQGEEDYGIDGPSEMAISYVMTLQEKEKFRLEGLGKLARPPMIGPASLKQHQANVLAGGITYMDDEGRGRLEPVFAVDPKLNELAQSQDMDIEDIRKCYFEDLFLMLTSEAPKTHVTKAAIEERAAERMQALVPILGQLDEDQNNKVIENALLLLGRMGALPPVPDELKGQQIRPEYISTLAKAARSASAFAVEKALGFAADLAQATGDTSLPRIFKLPEVVRAYADYVGADPNLIEDEVTYKKVQAEIAQQQAEMLRKEKEGQAAAIDKEKATAGKMDAERVATTQQGA